MVLPGLSVLLRDRHRLAGRRFGLVSHAAAVLPDLGGILDALLEAGVRIGALFGAEHGFSGAAMAGAAVESAADPRTGLPVYSLYGADEEPRPAMLANLADLDGLVVDFQDVGVRYYTYASTLFYLLRAAGKAGMPVWVLDRPNPLNGVSLDGPLLQPGYESFVGIARLPVRHGMTFGELALFLNGEYRLGAVLEVVAMRGWERRMWFDQTGLPWTPPSPAMPHLSTAVVYPGMCLIEGTNLSEGRGTALPFEVAGAPWLDGPALARRLNRLGLPGVGFRAHVFEPAAGKHAGVVCRGVQVHVIDRERFQAVRTGLWLAAACREQNPDTFTFLPAASGAARPHFDLLAGSERSRQAVENPAEIDGLAAGWLAEHERFAVLRQPYLLYH